MRYPFFCGSAWLRDTKRPLIEGEHSGFFFRVCGYGLHVSTKKREYALFSERYGFRKARYLFGLRFEVLTP